jgi:hypothetical protein
MVAQDIADEWDYWTNICSVQEFMDTGRAQGHPTIGAAVDAYTVEISGMGVATTRRRQTAGKTL